LQLHVVNIVLLLPRLIESKSSLFINFIQLAQIHDMNGNVGAKNYNNMLKIVNLKLIT